MSVIGNSFVFLSASLGSYIFLLILLAIFNFSLYFYTILYTDKKLSITTLNILPGNPLGQMDKFMNHTLSFLETIHLQIVLLVALFLVSKTVSSPPF